MAKISVIIPIYNTAKFLPQCLKSVVKQDYKNLEIILVNDASTDDSLLICQKFAQKESRIKIIDKYVNEGAELARFSGLYRATGEYIMYLDSDDWLSNRKVISSMYKNAVDTDADYVEINAVKTIDRFGIIKKPLKKTSVSGIITQPELFENYFISFFGSSGLQVNMWGKLYRKSFLDKVKFKAINIKNGEDIGFNLQLFPLLNKIFVMDEIGYCYRNSGMSSKFNPFLLPDLKKLYLLRQELIEKFSYSKALLSLHRELKEILKADIQQRIRFQQKKENILLFLKEEIEDPVYRAVTDFYKTNKLKDLFVYALAKKNVNKLYELSLIEERRLKLRRKFVGFISIILK